MNNNTNVRVCFKERFAQLRYETGLSQKRLGELLSLSPATIGYYENGDRLPDIETVRRIAEYFNVSADYLIGLSDAKATEQDMKIACEVTGLSEEAIENIKATNPYVYIKKMKDILPKPDKNAEQYYNSRSSIIKAFFESEEFKKIISAVAEAATYTHAHETDKKEARFLCEKLSLYYKDDLEEEKQRLTEIYMHKYDRIARTYAFDAYEKISAFAERIAKEQESKNAQHNPKKE